MTEPSKNIGRVQWLTFFGVEHFEGGKGGEGGVYPFHRLYHLSSTGSGKCHSKNDRRLILITTNKLKKKEI
jgi:hypothetical protein